MARRPGTVPALTGLVALLVAGCGGSGGLAPPGPSATGRAAAAAPTCSGTWSEQGSTATVQVRTPGPVSVEVTIYDANGHLVGEDPGSVIPAGQTGGAFRVSLRRTPAARAYLVLRGLPGSTAPGKTAGCPLPFT